MGLIALCSLSLIACGGGGGDEASAPAPEPPMLPPGTWAVIGSSTAAGTGAASGAGWVQRLSVAVAASGVEVTNLARPGLRTAHALPVSASAPASASRPAPDPAVNIDRALALNPRLLLLSFPNNDVVDGYAADETLRNLRVIRHAASAASAAALVLGSQPRDSLNDNQRLTLAEVDRQLAAEVGACFVPLYQALGDGQGRIASRYSLGDGVHVNDAGHQLIFQQVLAALVGGRCVRLGAR